MMTTKEINGLIERYGINGKTDDSYGYYFDNNIAPKIADKVTPELLESLLKKMNIKSASEMLVRTSPDIRQRLLQYYGIDILFTENDSEEIPLYQIASQELEKNLFWLKSSKLQKIINKINHINSTLSNHHRFIHCLIDQNTYEQKEDILFNLLVNHNLQFNEDDIYFLIDGHRGIKAIQYMLESATFKFSGFDGYHDKEYLLDLYFNFFNKFENLPNSFKEIVIEKSDHNNPYFVKAALKYGMLVEALSMIEKGYLFHREDISVLSYCKEKETVTTEHYKKLLDLKSDPKLAVGLIKSMIGFTGNAPLKLFQSCLEMGFPIEDDGVIHRLGSHQKNLANTERYVAAILPFVTKNHNNFFVACCQYGFLDQVKVLEKGINKIQCTDALKQAANANVVHYLLDLGISDVLAIEKTGKAEIVRVLIESNEYTIESAKAAFKKAIGEFGNTDIAITIWEHFQDVVLYNEEIIKKIKIKPELRNTILSPKTSKVDEIWEQLHQDFKMDINVDDNEYRGIRINGKVQFIGDEDIYIGRYNVYVNYHDLIMKIADTLGVDEKKEAVKNYILKKKREEEIINAFNKSHAVSYFNSCGSLGESSFYYDLKKQYGIEKEYKEGINIPMKDGFFYHSWGGRDGIDDYFIHFIVTKGKRSKSNLVKYISSYYALLSNVSKIANNAKKQCWECGRKFTFFEINIDEGTTSWEQFRRRIEMWEDNYCGC